MTTDCSHIDQAIRLALLGGNQIYTMVGRIAKNQNKVIWMRKPLDIEILKKEIDKECIKLSYWVFEGAPHNPPAKGYTCEECRVVLAFPNV